MPSRKKIIHKNGYRETVIANPFLRLWSRRYKILQYGISYLWDVELRRKAHVKKRNDRSRELYGSAWTAKKRMKKKMQLIERDGWRCNKCWVTLSLDEMTIDHIIPAFKSPKNHDLSNLQILCNQCNQLKSVGESKEAYSKFKR